MKKNSKRMLFILAAALTCGYFSIPSSNEVVCGNIEALTSGGDAPDEPKKSDVYTRLTSIPDRDERYWKNTYKYEDGKKTSWCKLVGNWQEIIENEKCYLE